VLAPDLAAAAEPTARLQRYAPGAADEMDPDQSNQIKCIAAAHQSIIPSTAACGLHDANPGQRVTVVCR
jgi:hypothetical protein